MDRICWWLANLVSRTLDRSEREAVIGDLVESGENAQQALHHVLSLVLLRQIALWSDWRLWSVLFTIIFPIGTLLCLVSREMLGIGSVYGWLYFNNWDARLLHSRAFWYVLQDSLRFLFGRYLAIGCWSWSAGFLLGRTVRFIRPRVMGTLFCYVLLIAALGAVPAYSGILQHEIHRVFPYALPRRERDPVTPIFFYRTILPLISTALFVALPGLWGMHEARTERAERNHLGTIASFAALVSLLPIATHIFGLVLLILITSGMRPDIWHGWTVSMRSLLDLLLLVSYWPFGYLVLTVAARVRARVQRLFLAQ
jgi:hypothetical protein